MNKMPLRIDLLHPGQAVQTAATKAQTPPALMGTIDALRVIAGDASQEGGSEMRQWKRKQGHE